MIKKYIVFFFSIAFLSSLLIFFITMYMGANPLNKSMSLRLKTSSIIPQGWAFFTRDSKEDRIYAFKLNPATNRFAEVNQRNASLDNYGGIGREIRLINAQLGLVISSIPSKERMHVYNWKTGDIESIINFKSSAFNYNEVAFNASQMAQLKKGCYLIMVEKMLPWQLLSKDAHYQSRIKIYPVILQ